MIYRLKKGQESFTPVEGPFARRTYKSGKTYAEIPPECRARFEEVGATPAPKAGARAPAAAKEKPAKADSRKAPGPAAVPSEGRR